MQKVTIYTDGSCHGNPGCGGYAAVTIYPNGMITEIHGSDWHTTNNRMELMAVIEALKEVPQNYGAHIISDSKYVVNPIAQGDLREYVNARGRKNADLWEIVLRLSAFHRLTAEWVKGHAGNPHNERCDELANKEADQVERESGVRLMVFKALLCDMTMTAEQIAEQCGGDVETVTKYRKQYFEKLGGRR